MAISYSLTQVKDSGSWRWYSFTCRSQDFNIYKYSRADLGRENYNIVILAHFL